MDKFQIIEITEQFNHAGTKATADIARIADRLGFERVCIKMDTTQESFLGKVRRQVGYLRDWSKAEKRITKDSVILLQHPFHYPQLSRVRTLRALKEKQIKVISVVHDVEQLRAFRFNEYYKYEFEVMLEISDVIIVHNDRMRQWFIERGVDTRKLISLKIFDYLQNNDSAKNVKFERSITIAGNLDTHKCGYIKELDLLKNVTVHLYGPNFNEELRNAGNIEYHGSYPVDEIPKKLNRGFGLVWDGESIEGCKGFSGQYLRYNNPHKLSLYLSSGLPVVIWQEAAEAKYVEDNGVGIVVNNLLELNEKLSILSEIEYRKLTKNVDKIKTFLCNGFYANDAISNALKIVENK